MRVEHHAPRNDVWDHRTDVRASDGNGLSLPDCCWCCPRVEDLVAYQEGRGEPFFLVTHFASGLAGMRLGG